MTSADASDASPKDLKVNGQARHARRPRGRGSLVAKMALKIDSHLDDDEEQAPPTPNTVAKAESTAALIKWASLGCLVVQNSSLFVVTRYSRLPREDGGLLYISSVVVLVVELCKMGICLGVIAWQGDIAPALRHHIWVEREQTVRTIS